MPEVDLADVTLAYDVVGEGEPVVLVCGCGQPAAAYQLGLAPALAAAGYTVVTYDNRGVEPSSSPPAPYSVAGMVADLLGLLDHLRLDRVRLVGHSMGGWIAETAAARHPERVGAAALMGSCNAATSWEKAITSVERDIAASDVELPRLFYATETLRYLPIHELQDDGVVDTWLSMIGDLEPWANPGRLGQYQACLAWSTDPQRTALWPELRVPCLVVAFEHDIDSPPARARQGAAAIAGARYVEIAGASHLGFLTHGDQVAAALLEFFADA